jgi:hypothetical protein
MIPVQISMLTDPRKNLSSPSNVYYFTVQDPD